MDYQIESVPFSFKISLFLSTLHFGTHLGHEDDVLWRTVKGKVVNLRYGIADPQDSG